MHQSSARLHTVAQLLGTPPKSPAGGLSGEPSSTAACSDASAREPRRQDHFLTALLLRKSPWGGFRGREFDVPLLSSGAEPQFRLAGTILSVLVLILAAVMGCSPAPRYTRSLAATPSSEVQDAHSIAPLPLMPENLAAADSLEATDQPPEVVDDSLPPAYTDTGSASYYHHKFTGRPTANGEIYEPSTLTAAHRTLPFKTRLRVTNLRTGNSVVVRINDRGPHTKSRIIDLSYAAAKKIDLLGTGHENVCITTDTTERPMQPELHP